jgi:hypothetical protein
MFCEFRPHLRAIERAFALHFWSDHRIKPGYYWSQTIRSEIEFAEVFILVVSPAFMGSDYIYDKELPAIRDRKKSVGALIVPVILEQCAWAWVCGALQAAPTEGGRLKPIADWGRRTKGFDRARQQIAEALQNYYGLVPNTFDWSVS